MTPSRPIKASARSSPLRAACASERGRRAWQSGGMCSKAGFTYWMVPARSVIAVPGLQPFPPERRNALPALDRCFTNLRDNTPRCHDGVTDRVPGQVRHAAQAELAHDVASVGRDGCMGDVQSGGHRGRAISLAIRRRISPASGRVGEGPASSNACKRWRSLGRASSCSLARTRRWLCSAMTGLARGGPGGLRYCGGPGSTTPSSGSAVSVSVQSATPALRSASRSAVVGAMACSLPASRSATASS